MGVIWVCPPTMLFVIISVSAFILSLNKRLFSWLFYCFGWEFLFVFHFVFVFFFFVFMCGFFGFVFVFSFLF